MAGLGNLPDKVMIEILSRLPISWYALFNDVYFASSLKSLYVILKRMVRIKDTEMYETKFSLFDYPFQSTSLINHLNLPCFVDQFPMFQINGHSQGLLCISLFPRDIFLCNPKCSYIPPSTLPINAQHFFDPFDDGVHSYPNAIGFGYDPKSRDFKVVRVVNYVDPPSFFRPPKAEVYRLRKGRWREIKTPFYGCAHEGSFELYYQGFYYWWGDSMLNKLCPKEGRPNILWRFNMSEEVSDHISVLSQNDNGRYKGMGVLNGSIVLFYRTDPGDEKSFDVWRMDFKDGEKESMGGVLWSKLFIIGPVLGVPIPLEYVSSYQLLMEYKEGQLLLYNTKTQHCKHLPLKGLPHLFQATVFVKTLLYVNGDDK